MRVFRILQKPFVDVALTGDGARRDGARWNSRGVPMVYCAESRALAVLEMLVHVDPATMPDDLCILTVNIPDDIFPVVLGPARLPKTWREYPAPTELRDIGDAWVTSLESCVLSVPSAVLPQERCYLLNPLHRDMARITVEKAEDFLFDPRLLA